MLERCVRLGLLLLALMIAQTAHAQADGSLMSAEPIVEPPPGMQAWRITYRSTDEDGNPMAMTGMVVAPREAVPPRPRPVIAWAHGTWGVVDNCTLSGKPAFFTATPALDEMIRRGFVVVAADYPGLGSTITHGYLVGRETAWSILDAVRAAQAVRGAAAGSRFAVWGESQGGHAALWTDLEAKRYAPDLTLVGTAAAAPPTDLIANLRQGSDANVRAMLTSYVAYSWSKRFAAPMSALFDKVNQGVAMRLAENNCVELGKTPRLGTILGLASVRNALRAKDIGKIQPWAGIARRNSVKASAIAGPLLIAQSDQDVVVAPAVTRAFAKAYCKRRHPLRFVSLPGSPHQDSARDSSTATLDWIADRFAGQALPDDCRSL